MDRIAVTAPLAALAMFVALPANAASVVIVRPANSPPVMVETLVRLKGELISAGFETEIVDGAEAGGPPGDPRAGLERLAAARGADAVVAILGDLAPDSVEVWVIDKVTGKSVVRRVPFEPATGRASKTLAIRAIELLRSSFLEIDLAAYDRKSGPAVPPAVAHFVESERLTGRPERFGVEVGGAAILSLDGVGPAFLPVVRFGWSWRPWFIAEGTLAGLGTRPTVGGLAGSAQVAQAYGVMGGSFRFRAGEWLRPFAALSAGLLHTSVEGRAEGPNRAHAADGWSFLIQSGVGALLRLPQRFYLSLAAEVQLMEPYPAIRFLERVVATSGRPNLLLTLTIGAWL